MCSCLKDEAGREIANPSEHHAFYGSKEQPKLIFGEDTAELAAFYQACQEMAPGAFTLLQELLDSWQPYALVHEWTLPDGFDARVKVMQKEETRIEVDELDHASFTYEYYVNQGSKKGLANVANVVHSIDAFILREMVRRCNHKSLNLAGIADWLAAEIMEREFNGVTPTTQQIEEAYDLTQHWERSGMRSAVILPYLTSVSVTGLPTKMLHELKLMVETMLQYKAFEIVTIHDSFAAHANNVNWVRHWYKEILAELAESEILSDIMGQLHGCTGQYQKLSSNLADYIRDSNYALS